MQFYTFDKQTKEFTPCTPHEWEAYAQKKSLRRIGFKKDRRTGYSVSTVALPFNHKFTYGDDQWFETIVFDQNRNEKEMRRYATYEEAIHGHEKLLQKYITPTT